MDLYNKIHTVIIIKESIEDREEKRANEEKHHLLCRDSFLLYQAADGVYGD
jgi:hypothetical protein